MSTAPPTVEHIPTEWAYRAHGPQAAFFDLDRTLISGSSAFTFGIAAWRKDMVPTRQFARDAVGAIAFKLRGDHGDEETVSKVRVRILRAVQAGIVLVVLGAALFLFLKWVALPYPVPENLGFLATVSSAIGLGLLVSSFVSYRLSRKMGLIENHAGHLPHVTTVS